MANNQVTEDINSDLTELEAKDFISQLPPKVAQFISEYAQNFRDSGIYFNKSLIVDVAGAIEKARIDLKEFEDMAFAERILSVFRSYEDAVLFIQSERQRSVRTIKKIAVLAADEIGEAESEGRSYDIERQK